MLFVPQLVIVPQKCIYTATVIFKIWFIFKLSWEQQIRKGAATVSCQMQSFRCQTACPSPQQGDQLYHVRLLCGKLLALCTAINQTAVAIIIDRNSAQFGCTINRSTSYFVVIFLTMQLLSERRIKTALAVTTVVAKSTRTENRS